MTRKEVVRMCLTEAMYGETHPLMGLVDYLIGECNISPDRLVLIAGRQFEIPPAAAWGALYDLRPIILQ